MIKLTGIAELLVLLKIKAYLSWTIIEGFGSGSFRVLSGNTNFCACPSNENHLKSVLKEQGTKYCIDHVHFKKDEKICDHKSITNVADSQQAKSNATQADFCLFHQTFCSLLCALLCLHHTHIPSLGSLLPYSPEQDLRAWKGCRGSPGESQISNGNSSGFAGGRQLVFKL